MSIPCNLVPLGVSGALPAGYTPLEFLQSSGGQYIDTGLHVDNGSVMSVDCEYDSAAVASNGAVFGAQNGGVYQDRAGWSEFAAGTHGWVFWGWLSVDQTIPSAPNERHRVELSQTGLYYNGVKLRDVDQGSFTTSWTCWLFARNRHDVTVEKYRGKIYAFTFVQGGKSKLDFIPCVDGKGEPCMFDRVSLQPYRNLGTGAFIAGIGTVGQLSSLLRKLPATGGALTLSLPAEANTPEMAEAMQACYDTKGWSITVHEYRSSTAATYSLRRVRSVVWCRKEQTEHGSYVAADGTRWQVERCAAIFGLHGQDPAAYGYTPFDSPEQAAVEWHLTPYIDPEEEQP